MDGLAVELGFPTGDLTPWYRVPNRTVIERGGSGLLDRYGGSLATLLAAIYPQHDWDPLRFRRVPANYWASVANQKRFLDRLGSELGIGVSELSKWYQVPRRVIVDRGGGRILDLYQDSIPAMLSAVYPHFSWDPLAFERAPRNYWASVTNQRSFLAEIGRRQLGINGEEDMTRWYKVSWKLIKDAGGGGLLAFHKDSISRMLLSAFPEYPWESWRFPRKEHRALSDPKALQTLMETVERALNISVPSDWLRVSYEQLRGIPTARPLISNRGILEKVLRERYPNAIWSDAAFNNRGELRRPSERS